MQKPSWATLAITKRYTAGQTGLLLPGSIYKRAGVVMDAMQVTADVNQAAMTASAIISTPTPDRSEDVVEPRGIKLDNYRRNPVVLFDHGEKIPGPVATCESPSGELSIRVYNDRVEATSYFSQSIPVSYQIFAMIAEKFIRATSVNFEPITARPRSRGRGERPGLHVSEWDLLEWSWVTIGDNPEAVRKLLDRGRIAGDVLCGPIRKSLASLAARPRRNQIQGFSFNTVEESNMPATNIAKKLFGDDEEADKKKAPPKATGKPPVGKAAAAPPVDDDEAAAAEAESEEGDEIPQDESSEFGDDEAAAAEMGEDGGMEMGVDGDPSLLADEDSRAPLGAQLYEATHEALGGMAQAIEDQMGPLEHPDAKNYLTKLISILQGIQTELQQLHGEHYPDRAGKLAVDGEAEADPVGTGGESMPPKGIQKLLSMSPVAKSRMRACAGRLEYIAKSNQVSRRARQALREVIDAVHGELRSVKTARIKKSVQPAEPETSAVEREALERFEKLQSRATEVLAKLEDAIPANRK